jgi:AcrR family transcriptional regulator
VNTAERPSNRRDQILDEATGLFSEKGYDGTSIRLIARACGISEAAIYRHFDHKVQLYEAVISRKAFEHDISGYLQKHCSGDIEAVLTTIAQHILSYIETDPELLRLMFNNSLESGPVAAVLFREFRLPYIKFLAGELERRMAAGEIREVDPYITGRCFIGMVVDCALSAGVWPKITEFKFNAGDVICNNVPIFARGLRTVSDPDQAQT